MPEGQLLVATKGRIGFLRQTDFNTPQTTDTSFDYFAFTGVDLTPVQGQNVLPPEAGNEPLPRGMFKTGIHVAGGVDLIPRLSDRFGWLLEAAFGDASSYTDQTVAQVIAAAGATPGVNAHLFGFQDADSFYLPYLTAHRLMPANLAADEVGEVFQDCRIAGFTLTANAAAVVTSRFDLLGRASGATVWDVNPGWSQPTYDDDSAFAVTSCLGEFKASVTGGTPGTLTAFDVRQITLTVANAMLPPDRSRRIGNPHPKDFPVLSRNIGISAVLMLEDYDLYVQTFGGPANPVVDTAWSCIPLDGDIDFTLQSPAEIAATGEYYLFRFRTTAGNVKLMARPIVLMPNEPVLMQVQGTIARPSTGRAFYAYLQNATLSYD